MKLYFIYNANSGVFNSLSDIAHKTLKPETYQCNLCKLTHGLLFEKKKWTNFNAQLKIETEYLHKDFLPKKLQGLSKTYPIILLEQNSTIETFISTAKIEEIISLDQLIEMVTSQLSSAVPNYFN